LYAAKAVCVAASGTYCSGSVEAAGVDGVAAGVLGFGVVAAGVLGFGVGVGVGSAWPSTLLQARPFGVALGVTVALGVVLGLTVVLGFGVALGFGVPVGVGDGVATGAAAWASYTIRK
jgi:hypothetical protein